MGFFFLLGVREFDRCRGAFDLEDKDYNGVGELDFRYAGVFGGRGGYVSFFERY